MQIDSLEQKSLDMPKFDLADKMHELNGKFISKVSPEKHYFQHINSSVDNNIGKWLNVDNPAKISELRPTTFSSVKKMLYGSGLDGEKSLLDISKEKINPAYHNTNVKQHAGFAAEVIGTTKENLIAKVEGTGVRTIRADELSAATKIKYGISSGINDQYIDKIRENVDGTFEKVQVKFVGNDGVTNLRKLASKKFDKYFEVGKVDKMEIPSDFYDDIRNNDLIGKKITKINTMLEHAKTGGNTELTEKYAKQIERYTKIDHMIDRSTLSSWESQFATLRPNTYSMQLFKKTDLKIHENLYKATVQADRMFGESHQRGEQAGLQAAKLTFAIATVDNVSKVISGELSAKDALENVGKATGIAGAAGYGTQFITTNVARAMSTSGTELIQTLGKTDVPAVVVSFGVTSYGAVSEFAQGKINTKELVEKLGGNAVGTAGSFEGAAIGAEIGEKAGAVIGTVSMPVPGVGTISGAAIGATAGGLVGGMVGYAVTTEAYKSALEVGSKGAGILKANAHDFAKQTVEIATKNVPDKVADIRGAINDFADSNKLGIHV